MRVSVETVSFFRHHFERKQRGATACKNSTTVSGAVQRVLTERTPAVSGVGGAAVTHADVREDGGEANGALYDPALKIYKNSSQRVDPVYRVTARSTHFTKKNQSPPANTPTTNQQRISA